MTDTGQSPDSPDAHDAMHDVMHDVMTVGATSTAGEILDGRYRLEEHISDDSHGRQVWRGIDVVLRRPVAIVLRHPGGDTAAEMMSAAVAASRIGHSNLVDVYDAIDEGTRAYVVREWVEGASLRELVADGPLDSGRATAVAHAVAGAIAAAHATGMSHGNVHAGTVLIADDGRVVLTDARADESVTMEQDVRAVGGILYAALTAHWPHAELGPDALPDGVRDAAGTLASPRQVRGGLPSYLSDLSMDLINPDLSPPAADALAAEFGRLDTDGGEEFFSDGGPLGFVTPLRSTEPDVPTRTGRNLAIGVAALLVIAAGALVVSLKLTVDNSPGVARGAVTPPSSSASTTPSQQGAPITLASDQVRIVDPPRGDRNELDGTADMVDGDESTGWTSSWYNSATFGQIKPGMGVLIDLGKPTNVTSLKVDFGGPGATVSARLGSTDPGDTSSGDEQVFQTYRQVGSSQVAGSTAVLPVGEKTRYLLLWIQKLPKAPSNLPGKFQITINEITVNGG